MAMYKLQFTERHAFHWGGKWHAYNEKLSQYGVNFHTHSHVQTHTYTHSLTWTDVHKHTHTYVHRCTHTYPQDKSYIDNDKALLKITNAYWSNGNKMFKYIW